MEGISSKPESSAETERCNLFSSWPDGESGRSGIKSSPRCRNVPDESANDLAEELGDALWYLARLSATLGFSLSTIAALNIEKIRRRKAERESRDENR